MKTINKSQLREHIAKLVAEQANSIYTVDGSTFEENYEKEIIAPLREAFMLLKKAKLAAKELKMQSFYDEIDDAQRSIWYMIKDEFMTRITKDELKELIREAVLQEIAPGRGGTIAQGLMQKN